MLCTVFCVFIIQIRYIPSESVFDAVKAFSKDREKPCRKVEIVGGRCQRCGARMRPKRHVTASETGALFDAFWRMITEGKSFRRSNPAELRK